MAIKKNIDRQWPLAFYAEFGHGNLGANNGIEVVLPPGAVLLRLLVLTTTAFNGTTPVLTASDGTTTFANAVDLTSTGSETVANVPKFYPTGGKLTLSGTVTGSPTAGAAKVIGEYVVAKRGNEVAE
ncbi:MAG TPA: hypothetical protein PKZ27_02750 [Rhodocyclaceae bacterium]|nr:hypothetical protein [Burkholderiaceae bacterium]HRP74484.1 hypothetical protein [Rhodocyclaceae bacterium]